MKNGLLLAEGLCILLALPSLAMAHCGHCHADEVIDATTVEAPTASDVLGPANAETVSYPAPSPDDKLPIVTHSNDPVGEPFRLFAADFGVFPNPSRWKETATDGNVGFVQGAPVTLTWGIVPDGTEFQNFTGFTNATTPGGSDLIAFLDAHLGSASDTGVSDLQAKSWFPIVASVYERYDELSGLTFNYEPNDDAAPLNGTSISATALGETGVRADLRLSGGVREFTFDPLAFNAPPDNGDGVIRTEVVTFAGVSNVATNNSTLVNFLPFRNILAHEVGHGLGIQHLVSNDEGFLLEPMLGLGFDGPQYSEILAIQRNYGDVYEAGSGNDTAATATPIGSFGVGDDWVIGADASSTFIVSEVQPDEVDFFSIDGAQDVDYYAFSVDEFTELTATLNQVGGVYSTDTALNSGVQADVDTRILADLQLAIVAINPDGSTTQLALVNNEGLDSTITTGPEEEIDDLVLSPGIEYAAVVQQAAGSPDQIQTYELELDFAFALPPEPDLAGDYNLDGVVDAADYTVWRDTLGTTGIVAFTGADGNGDGEVTVADYQLFVSNFGTTLDSVTASAALPEPQVALLIGLASIGMLARRRR